MTRKFKKYFITGITGSGGSYLAEYILKKDKKAKIYGSYRSTGYLNYLKKNYKKKINFFKMDLTNFLRTKTVINKVKPDVIFHFASNADVRGSFDRPMNIIYNNNQLTINLLEAIRILNLNSLILICSSSEVYGNVKKKDVPITEEQPIRPVSPYSTSKAFQDLISQVYCESYSLNIIITRMFSYTNARRNNLFQTAFANQIVKIENNKQKKLRHGNLNSIRTFIDIEDAMNAYWLTAKSGKVGEIYNIGGNKTISVKNYLNELIRISKRKIQTKQDKKLIRPKDVTLQIPNVSKFKRHVKWKPKITFKQSVTNLLNVCRRNFKNQQIKI